MRQRFFRVLAPLALLPLAVLIAFLFAFLSGISPGPAFAQQRTLCVHGLEAPQALMVRSGPGLGSRVIGRFPAKSCGVSLAGRCEGEWCDMALGETRGWVNSKHIGVYELPRAATAGSSVPNAGSPPAPVEKPPAADRPQARAAASARQTEQGSSDDDDGSCVKRVDRDDTLRIRSGPGVDNDEIGEIPPRACGVAVSETCEGRWCRITYRGRRGWVNTYYID